MLLYVASNSINYDTLVNYKKVEKNYQLIYSEYGIYKIENDILYKLTILNEQSKSISINNKNVLIDESTLSYDIVNSIPINHLRLTIRAEHYKLNKNVVLIIEYNDKKLYNVYFINNSNQVDAIINSFL